MPKPEVDKTYEIDSDYFDKPIKLTVRKGKVIWCSDGSHPVGTDWPNLKLYYETRPWGEFKINELKEE